MSSPPFEWVPPPLSAPTSAAAKLPVNKEEFEAPWFNVLHTGSNPKIKIFIFAHAGGSVNAYKDMGKVFGDNCQIIGCELPGHILRFDEEPWQNVEELTDEYAKRMAPFCKRIFVLYGHSFGAQIALRISQKLSETYGCIPSALLVAGTYPCSWYNEADTDPEIAEQSDEVLVETLKKLEQPDIETQLADPEMKKFILKQVKGDAMLFYHYMAPKTKFETPIICYAGLGEEWTSKTDMMHWKVHSKGKENRANFKIKYFEGGHFFFRESEEQTNEFYSTIFSDLKNLGLRL